MAVRVRTGSSFTAVVAWDDANGAPQAIADGQTVTVTVTDAAGVELYSDVAATVANGMASFTLSAVVQPDRLTLDWVWSTATKSTVVEVAGDHIFTVAQAQAARMIDPAGTAEAQKRYPDSDIILVREAIAVEAERITGVAWVPRLDVETLSSHGGQYLQVRWPQLRGVRSVVIDGVAWTSSQIANLVVDDDYIMYPGYWPEGTRHITVAYEHGYDSPPSDLVDAFLVATKVAIDAGLTDGRGIDPKARFIKVNDEMVRLNRIDSMRTGIDAVDAAYEAHNHRRVLQ